MTLVLLTNSSSSPWSRPGDWVDAGHTVQLIAAGGGGNTGSTGSSGHGGGGAGGAGYTGLSSPVGSLGSTTPFAVPAATTGGSLASPQNGQAVCWEDTSVIGNCYGATGGSADSTNTGGGGGAGNQIFGTPSPVTYTHTGSNGGNGGGDSTTTTGGGGGGGGGAAGPDGAGKAGGANAQGSAFLGGAGGGGADNGTAGSTAATSTSGPGGNGNNGSGGAGIANLTTGQTAGTGNSGSGGGGGGGGAGSSTTTASQVHNGGPGGTLGNTTNWTDTSGGPNNGTSAGAGGGGGGAGGCSGNVTGTSTGGVGASYGGGGGGGGGMRGTSSTVAGGGGGAGVIAITYFPVTGPAGEQYFDLPPSDLAPLLATSLRPDLRTWTASFPLELIGQDRLPTGNKYFDLTGRPPLMPDLRTWTWKYNQNLIGKDFFPPGNEWFDLAPIFRGHKQPVEKFVPPNLLTSTLFTVPAPANQYDWPLPKVPNRPDGTWLWNYNQNLIGQDALPVGEIIFETPRAPPPQHPQRTWTNSYLLTLLGQDAFPPGQEWFDRPPPGAPLQFNQRTWTWQYNLNLIGQDVMPPGSVDTELAPRGYPPQHQQRSWAWWYALNLIGTDKFPPGETIYDRTPQAPPRLDATFTAFYNPNLIGQDRLPVGEQYTDAPPHPVWLRQWELWLQQTTLAPSTTPFAQLDWPLPGRARPIDPTWLAAPIPSTLAAVAPFAQYDWPLSIRARPLDATWLFAPAPGALLAPFRQLDWPLTPAARFDLRTLATGYNLSLIGQDALPVGEQITELAKAPPLQHAQRRWEWWFNLNLLGKDALPAGEQLSDLVPRAPLAGVDLRTFVGFYNLNLIGADRLPFFQTSWPLPGRAAPIDTTWLHGFVAGNLLAPFAQYDWPVPTPPALQLNQRTWTASYNQNLIGQDRFPPGEAVTDLWPRPPAPQPDLRTWTNPLYIYGFVVQPPPKALNFDWPVPTPPIYHVQFRTWTASYPIELIGQDQLPNRQQDWPIPTRAKAIDAGWLFAFIPSELVTQAPFAQYDWPLARRPAPIDPTWVFAPAPGSLLAPFAQRDWPLPGRAPPIDPTWIRGLTAGALLAPFRQTDWPVPVAAPLQLAQRGFTASYDLSLIGQDQLPVGENMFDLAPRAPAPMPDLRTWLWSMYVGTFTAQVPPPTNYDWPLPTRARPIDPTWLVPGLKVAAQIAVPFIWPLPWWDRYTSDLRTQTSSPPLALTRTAAITQIALPPLWSLPWWDRYTSDLRTWAPQASLALTSPPGIPPPTNYDWPLPRRPAPIDPSWLARFPLGLIGKDRFPAGSRIFDLAPIAAPRLGVPVAFTASFPRVLIGKDRLPNRQQDWPLAPGPRPLLQTWQLPTTLLPRPTVQNPFAQRDWPLPVRPARLDQTIAFTGPVEQFSPIALPYIWDPPWWDRYTTDLRTWTLSFPPPPPLPFNQIDWPLPRVPKPIEQTVAQFYPLVLIGKDLLPQLQHDWPVPAAPQALWTLRQWTAFSTIYLPQFKISPNLIARAQPRTFQVTAAQREMIVLAAPRHRVAAEQTNTTMSQENVLEPNIDAVLEFETVTFDYGKMLAAVGNTAAIVSINALIITVIDGIDPTPTARLSGSPSIGPSPFNGNPFQAVFQLVGGCLAGVTYQIQCVVNMSDGQKLSIKTQIACS